MLQLHVVHLDTRKILIFNSLYITHDNFEKKWWHDVFNFTTRDILGYFRKYLRVEDMEFQRVLKKEHVEFPWVLVLDLGISKGYRTTLQNFQE